jgi:beta-galactosidase
MRFGRSDALHDAPVFNEVLAAIEDKVSVLASYTSDYYAEQPAVTLHQKGKGRVVHFGCFFTAQNLAALLDALAIEDPLATWADIPAEVQTVVRSNGTEKFCFLLNFTNKSQPVTFKESVLDLLAGQKLQGHTEIPPYGVHLIRLTSEI